MLERPSTVGVRDPAAGVPDAAVHTPGLLGRLFARVRRLARFAYELLTQSP
jgi:hypothetical protein